MNKYMYKYILFLCATVKLFSANFYVDGTATGSNNGSSWTHAWTTLAAVTGVSAGDTVFISGGSTGNSKQYTTTTHGSYPGQWLNVTNGVTYKIGQDAGHNGTVILDGAGGPYMLVQTKTDVIYSGDAGDGLMHFVFQNANSVANAANWDGVRVTYCDFTAIGGTSGAGLMSFNPATNVEVDHCSFYGSHAQLDNIAYGVFTGSGYDSGMRWHHNTMSVPFASGLTGFGADALQFNGTGWSVYSNTFIGYSAAYTGGQHGDGVQSLSASYAKIYGNHFVNLQSYDVYLEALSGGGGFDNCLVYNNVCVNATGSGTQALVISGSVADPCDYVVLANNTADGFANTYTFRNPSNNPLSGAFNNCSIYNNVAVQPSGANVFDTSIVNTADNVTVTAGNAATYFTAYTAGSASNDYHLTSSATPLIGTGTDASAFIGSLDKAGTARTAPWDIGAYKYASGDTTPPTPNPATIASTGHTSTTITVTATTATDETSLGSAPYRFSSDNGSSWTSYQSSATYVFTGLTPSTSYPIKVQYRDAAGNAGTASSASSVTTDAVVAPASVHQRPGARIGVGL